MTLRQFRRGGLGESVVESPYRGLITHLVVPRPQLLPYMMKSSCQHAALRSNFAPGSSPAPVILGELREPGYFCRLADCRFVARNEGRLPSMWAARARNPHSKDKAPLQPIERRGAKGHDARLRGCWTARTGTAVRVAATVQP